MPEGAAEKGHQLLSIQYRGDCARLYANGRLVADNFYNGRPLLFGLWRLREMGITAESLELRILPLQPDMPVYFGEGDTSRTGEEVMSVSMREG